MTASVLSLLLGKQLSSATLRFYFEYDSLEERNCVVSTSLLLYLVFSGALLGICAFFAERFSYFIFSTSGYTTHFIVTFVLLYFNLSEEILLSYVRAIDRAFLFVVVSVSGLIAKMLLCIYLVSFENWGILGVLVGNLVGSVIVWTMLSVFTFRRVGFSVDFRKFGEIAKYGLPLMAAGASGVVIGNLGRFFLNWYVSLSAVGIYALAMRLASILRFLVVQPFGKAYGPFRFAVMKQADAKAIYARVATYFIGVCIWVIVGMIGLSGEILQIMAKENYWAARAVIPILLVSNLLGSGVYYMFQIGVYLQRKTKALSWLFAGAAMLDIGLMLVLVPRFGVYGAASSQVVAHGVVAFMGLYLSQRVYPIKYEWSRLLKIAALGMIASLALYSGYHVNPYLSAAIKLPIILLFPFSLFLVGFFDSGELAQFRGIWGRLRAQTAVARE